MGQKVNPIVMRLSLNKDINDYNTYDSPLGFKPSTSRGSVSEQRPNMSTMNFSGPKDKRDKGAMQGLPA